MSTKDLDLRSDEHNAATNPENEQGATLWHYKAGTAFFTDSFPSCFYYCIWEEKKKEREKKAFIKIIIK